jgi:hypothetical protein
VRNLARLTSDALPTTQKAAQVLIAHAGDSPHPLVPPLEFCSWVSPKDAAKRRPDRKRSSNVESQPANH